MAPSNVYARAPSIFSSSGIWQLMHSLSLLYSVFAVETMLPILCINVLFQSWYVPFIHPSPLPLVLLLVRMLFHDCYHARHFSDITFYTHSRWQAHCLYHPGHICAAPRFWKRWILPGLLGRNAQSGPIAQIGDEAWRCACCLFDVILWLTPALQVDPCAWWIITVKKSECGGSLQKMYTDSWCCTRTDYRWMDGSNNGSMDIISSALMSHWFIQSKPITFWLDCS